MVAAVISSLVGRQFLGQTVSLEYPGDSFPMYAKTYNSCASILSPKCPVSPCKCEASAPEAVGSASSWLRVTPAASAASQPHSAAFWGEVSSNLNEWSKSTKPWWHTDVWGEDTQCKICHQQPWRSHQALSARTLEELPDSHLLVSCPPEPWCPAFLIAAFSFFASKLSLSLMCRCRIRDLTI